MNNRQLLIAKAGVNYAASQSDSTAETATSPYDLADGALGLFYMNAGQWKLVDGTNPGTKNIANIPTLYIAQGVPVGNAPVIIEIEGTGLLAYLGKSYLAPKAQVVYIGTDGTNGSGITSADDTDFTLKVVLKFRQRLPKVPTKTITVTSKTTGNTAYSIAVQLANEVNAQPADSDFSVGFPYLAEVVSNGTRTAFAAGSGDATSVHVVNGSTSVTYVKAADAAATIQTALTDGMFVKIQGVLYKTSANTTSGFTIDRAYTGATESIAFSDSDTGTYTTTEPTLIGIRLTGDAVNQQSEFGCMDGLKSADIIYSVNAIPGSGTYDEIVYAENYAHHYKGYFHPGYAFPERPPVYSVAGETYDLVTLTHYASRESMDGAHDRQTSTMHSQVAIPASLTGMGNFLTYLNAWTATTPLAPASVSV